MQTTGVTTVNSIFTAVSREIEKQKVGSGAHKNKTVIHKNKTCTSYKDAMNKHNTSTPQ